MILTRRLLVSCCHAGGSLYTIARDGTVTRHLSGELRGVDIGDGLVFVANCQLGFQALDLRDFSTVSSFDFPGRDLHGISFDPKNGWLYATCSASNTVVAFDVHRGWKVVARQTFTEESNGHWINDILVLPDRILVSMWSLTNRIKGKNYHYDGGVVELNKKDLSWGKVLISGAEVIHDVYLFNNEIYHCESVKGHACCQGQPVANINGYARGLAVDDECIYLGESQMRGTNLHQTMQWGGRRFVSNRGGIHIFNKKTAGYSWIDLPSPEVFDILLLD